MRRKIGLILLLILLAALSCAKGEGTSLSQTQPETAASSLTLSLLGDCSIGTSFNTIKSSVGFTSVVNEKGMDWPFSLVKDYLIKDDLTLANLEVCLTERTRHIDKAHPLIGSPSNVSVLTAGGIDMVNTVNNHCFDFYSGGYEDTLATLDKADLAHFGTAEQGSKFYDDTPTLTINGIKLGFIGYSYPSGYDQKQIIARIQALRAQGCELVIVSLHWGREKKSAPTIGQVNFAKAVLDAGADVIWGHHPHVLQPIVMYKGKPIFFSTGNFTFGTMSQVDPATGIFQLTYTKSETGVSLQTMKVIPCQTQGSGDYRPFELTEAEARQKVWAKLISKKSYADCSNLADSFLTAGVVQFKGSDD